MHGRSRCVDVIHHQHTLGNPATDLEGAGEVENTLRPAQSRLAGRVLSASKEMRFYRQSKHSRNQLRLVEAPLAGARPMEWHGHDDLRFEAFLQQAVSEQRSQR